MDDVIVDAIPGRMHPGAAAGANDAVARARKIITAFRENTTGPFVVDGESIELPVVRSMYSVLAIADRIASNRQPG